MAANGLLESDGFAQKASVIGCLRGSPYVMVHCHRTSQQPKIYASERFSWELFNHRRPQDMRPVDCDPVCRLRWLLQDCCPGYRGLFETSDLVTKHKSRRWPSSALMQQSGNVADLAFLRGVWLYTSVMTPMHFPHGLHSWITSLQLIPRWEKGEVIPKDYLEYLE